MEHKNSMSRVERLHREKVTRYSIRKYSFGAASVAVAALFMFLGNGAVSANELSKQDTPSVEAPAKATEDKTISEEATAKPAEATTPTLDKSELTNLISEIETKLSNGSYDNKTEESVAVLKADLEAAKATLANATTQAELKKAYSKLVTTANAGLRNKPVEKKETPAVDTTNGQPTVGKKADNTEKNPESNSIENTGSKDSRNGQALDKNNAFRAETDTEKPTVEIPFANGKNVYVYSGEAEGFDIKIKDNSGFITSATVKQGGNRNFNSVAGETDKRDVQYGYTINEITTKTPASDASPAVIHYRGVPGGELSAAQLEKIRTEGLTLGWRYVTATDEAGNFIENRAVGSSNATDPGSFNVIAKPQTFKYDPVALETANKVVVADLAQLTETDLNNIKNALKVEYSKTNDDAQLASKKGTLLDDAKTVVSSVAQSGSNLTVTYKDGSTDSIAVSSVARVNAAPTVEIPYSDPAAKEVYVYGGEENSFDIKFKDDSGKITSATVRQGGNKEFTPVAGEADKINVQYGYKANVISTETPATEASPAVITYRGTPAPEGTFTQANLEAATKGENPPGVALGWRYATATDADGALIENRAVGSTTATDPGAFRVMLKPQTQKYDIKNPETKISVANANNITEDEFNQIKDSIKIQYSTTNSDKNLADKKGQLVDNQTERIESITRNGNDVVVTYKDGSTDKKPLSEFVNVAPKVELPYSNEANKQIYVYTGENTDLTFKGTDEKEIKDLYLRGPGDISWNNTSGYGLPTGKVENGEVTGEGSVSEDKTSAIIKMTGKTNLAAGKQWTSFVVSKDNDGKLSNTDYRALDKDPNARQKPGYVQFIVKNQTSKYDIAAPTEKVAVADPANVTADDLAKIKEKLQIEYAQTNDDANFADKKGKTVDAEDAKTKIKSVEKDADGKLVVTYTDGSTDKKPLSDFVTLDKQPAIEAVEKAAEAQIAAINKTPNATDDEKQAAIDKVNADKEKALTAINDANVTTKDALDKAKESGTTAIAADNPVVAKKDAAKADVEAARKAKEDAIKANPNLTQAEKDAAIAKNNTAAAEATKAIDSATTNDAVDAAKTAGTGEIAKVNPVAKEAAKKAVADELADKEKAIDARTDLTDAEKAAAKDDAKAKAKAATDAINAQPDNAETPEKATEAQTAVDGAKDKGVADVKAVNPVAKEAAKKAIADELAEKEKAIDGRTDLTDEEKAAAKKDAQDKAKEATDAIDAQPSNAATPEKAAEAQTAVNGAKDKGVADVKAVDPAAAKKPAAKKAIDDALKAKEDAIDARTDLTDDEKKAAKDLAKAEADKAKAAIDAATTDAAVDTAKDAGTGAVEAINPEAKAKPEAKKAIDDALKAKEDAIDARTDLTDDEKKAAKDAAKEAADKAKAAIDAAPSNAEVDKAKEAGTGEIAKVNPVAKEAAKKAVADELAKKEAEIAGRNDLTDEEKAKAKEEAQAKAKEATDAIDAQPSNAETPEKAAEAQTAVDGAKDKGVADVKAVDPEAKAKPAAKKAIEDKLAKQLEDIANTPDATDDEKKVAADAAKALAEGAKKEIDKAGTDAEVKQLQEEAEGEIEKSVPVVEDKPNARKAIEDEAKAKKEAIDARTDLTPKAKEDLKAQVDAIADQAKKSVDAAKTSEAVDGIEESDKAAIKAVGEVNIPADKVLVNNPSALTDDEKAKVLEAVKKVNPDAKEITQDADGNVTVTTPDGHKEIITPEQVVKTAATANDPKAGNDIVKPADKVVVNDPAKLTDAEKEKIKAAVEAVNPNSIVVVDDKGNAKVSTPDGQTQVIPVEELVRTVEDTKKPNAGNDIVKPADKTVVANPEKLTDTEKKAIEDKVKAVNPDATVVVDDKGNTTVTTPEGKTAVIPAADLTKDPETATKPNAGNDIVKPADKTAVKDPANLTPEEKKAIEDKVKAVNPGATVVVDDKGNATVTTPEGKTAVIPATDLTKDPEAATKPNAGNDIVKPADKTAVKDPANLTPEEKKAIEDKVKAVNPGATVVVDDKGNATVTTPEGKTAVIPATDLTKSPADAAKANAGNTVNTPAAKVEVKDPAKLTDEEKAKVKEAIEAVNPGSKVVVDDKGNATVTTPEGDVVVIPTTDLTKSPADAGKANAGNAVNTPAAKVEVKDPAKLTDEEKAKVKKAVEDVNPGSKVVVDDKGNTTVTTSEGKTATIPAADVTKSAADAGKANAGNAVNTPAAKVEVKDPANLTDAEKKAIEDKVKAVNPGSKVVVDDKGNVTVTTPEGKTATIPAADVTKSAADAGKANAGNGANTPATKTVVKDPAKLTDEEKAKVKKAVEDVNPGSTVVVNDKGDVIVTKGDGTVLVIPELDLVIPEDKLTDPTQQNGVNTPATRVLVGDKAKLTADEIEKVKESIKAVNPGSTVVVDDKGNATVTTPEGKTATIPAAQLVKDAKDVAAKNNGENINVDFEKETVADFNNLTDAEKEAAKAKIKGANADVVEVIFDKAGNATVITKDGKVYTIVAKDIFKQRPYVPSNGGGNNSGNGNGTSGNNGATNTDAKVDKAKLEGAIRQLDELIVKESAKLDAETAKEANALLADAKKVFANADASQAEVDAMVKRIEGFMAKVASSTDHATPANDQAAQTPAVDTATTQAASAQANARKVAKELPNTGTADSTVAMVAAAASALLGLGLAGRRRKEDEEA